MKFDIRQLKQDTLGGLLLHLLLASGIVLALFLLYFFAYRPATTNHGETITVPSIEGMQMDQLEDFLIGYRVLIADDYELFVVMYELRDVLPK